MAHVLDSRHGHTHVASNPILHSGDSSNECWYNYPTCEPCSVAYMVACPTTWMHSNVCVCVCVYVDACHTKLHTGDEPSKTRTPYVCVCLWHCLLIVYLTGWINSIKSETFYEQLINVLRPVMTPMLKIHSLASWLLDWFVWQLNCVCLLNLSLWFSNIRCNLVADLVSIKAIVTD